MRIELVNYQAALCTYLFNLSLIYCYMYIVI